MTGPAILQNLDVKQICEVSELNLRLSLGLSQIDKLKRGTWYKAEMTAVQLEALQHGRDGKSMAPCVT